MTGIEPAYSAWGAVSSGALAYLLSRSRSRRSATALSATARYRSALPAGTEAASQAEIDRALAELRFSTDKSVTPKGAAPGTNDEIARAVRDWRYLEHLADELTVLRQTEYGRTSRPSTRYEWR